MIIYFSFAKIMNPSTSKLDAGQVVEVNRADRWQVHRRLQELSLRSHCGTNQPLIVEIDDVIEGIQLWSVVRQLTAPRRDLVSWLERCWRIRHGSNQ